MFGPRLRLCRVSGISIKVDASWFVVATLVTWTLAEGLFPREDPGLTRLQAWSMLVRSASCFAGSALTPFTDAILLLPTRCPPSGRQT